jgi:putative Mg2+ transporter-C (MgtC) family protein
MLRGRVRGWLAPARNTGPVANSDLALLVRILVGFGLAYLFGFERQLRGSVAGDRTFSMVGAAAAAITAVAAKTSPQAIAGVITGVGFIGGGVVLRGQMGTIRGVTTAAAVFAAAGVGVVVGFGHLLLGVITTALLLLTLELQHIPFLRCLDAARYSGRFQNDRVETGADGSPPDPN